MCSALIGSSPASTRVDQVAVALDQALDRQAHLFLGQAAHLEQPGLELLELFLEMPDDAFRRGSISRTFP